MKAFTGTLLVLGLITILAGVAALFVNPAYAIDWCLSSYPNEETWVNECCEEADPPRRYKCFESGDWCCYATDQGNCQGMNCPAK